MDANTPHDPSLPAAAPLRGVRVIDLSRYLPGPLVSRLLADLGAEVIKVEEPSLGDPARLAPPLVDGRGSLAALLLSGHRSIALDLKKDAAREVLEDLLLGADVLVESFRPGGLGGLGLPPERLRELFPGLVVCAVTGFGQEGPHAHRAGHDLTYQAVAGLARLGRRHAFGAGGRHRRRLERRPGGDRRAPPPPRDRRRLLHRPGPGRRRRPRRDHLVGGRSRRSQGRGEPLPLTGASPCYDLYRTRDDRTLALAALEPKFWATLCNALGEKELVRQQSPARRRCAAGSRG